MTNDGQIMVSDEKTTGKMEETRLISGGFVAGMWGKKPSPANKWTPEPSRTAYTINRMMYY